MRTVMQTLKHKVGASMGAKLVSQVAWKASALEIMADQPASLKKEIQKFRM